MSRYEKSIDLQIKYQHCDSIRMIKIDSSRKETKLDSHIPLTFNMKSAVDNNSIETKRIISDI